MLHGLSLGRARFDAGDVSFRHLPITRQPEEQRHVDADSFADELLDGRQPFGRRRDLDEDIRPVQRGPQPAGFLHRALVSCARWGLTSRLTYPSLPSVLS